MINKLFLSQLPWATTLLESPEKTQENPLADLSLFQAVGLEIIYILLF